MSRNGVLVAGVAAVAVLAVVGGGVVALRRTPQVSATAAAAPLHESPSTTAGPATPVKVTLNLSKLPVGRAPQMSYLQGRTVRGGGGQDVTVPGKQNILDATRYDGSLLVLLEVGLGGSELARIDDGSTFALQRIPDVQSLVSSLDQQAVAYGTAPVNADHTRKKGSDVYWETSSGQRTLNRPDDWGTTVLGVAGSHVFFKSDTDRDGLTSTFSSWDAGTGKVTQLKSVRSPEGVNGAGTAVVDFVAGAAQNFCSTLTDTASGKQLWRTCEYAVNGFTPSGGTAIGTPDFRGGGSDPLVAALNAKDGSVQRQWSGPQFVQSVAEDDDHLLMVADTGENTRTAIIRCSIATGACELATPLTKAARYDIRLLGAWQ
ncbi:hypothetical protein F1D05_23695 [Kribbella qitaiheensis]|uniref:Uncharacterized protein n=1 Tax=Kribbella qitaiheensis TaxID=1544730 RepID=A0A7G6X295_9ACTN|nr:hypothetical protein [Kribbella qitaiheensis]QNE20360.1 hypothetical protein F1D05_23695 [Kribbella qitaiheensis]